LFGCGCWAENDQKGKVGVGVSTSGITSYINITFIINIIFVIVIAILLVADFWLVKEISASY